MSYTATKRKKNHIWKNIPWDTSVNRIRRPNQHKNVSQQSAQQIKSPSLPWETSLVYSYKVLNELNISSMGNSANATVAVNKK